MININTFIENVKDYYNETGEILTFHKYNKIYGKIKYLRNHKYTWNEVLKLAGLKLQTKMNDLALNSLLNYLKDNKIRFKLLSEYNINKQNILELETVSINLKYSKLSSKNRYCFKNKYKEFNLLGIAEFGQLYYFDNLKENFPDNISVAIRKGRYKKYEVKNFKELLNIINTSAE